MAVTMAVVANKKKRSSPVMLVTTTARTEEEEIVETITMYHASCNIYKLYNYAMKNLSIIIPRKCLDSVAGYVSKT